MSSGAGSVERSGERHVDQVGPPPRAPRPPRAAAHLGSAAPHSTPERRENTNRFPTRHRARSFAFEFWKVHALSRSPLFKSKLAENIIRFIEFSFKYIFLLFLFVLWKCLQNITLWDVCVFSQYLLVVNFASELRHSFHDFIRVSILVFSWLILNLRGHSLIPWLLYEVGLS